MASIYWIYLSITLHSGRKSHTRIPCGKNGSINLELVKSLFISENEKGFGERGRKDEEGKGQRIRGGKEGRGWENTHQQSNSRNFIKWNGRFTDSRSSIGVTLQRKATTQKSLTPKNHWFTRTAGMGRDHPGLEIEHREDKGQNNYVSLVYTAYRNTHWNRNGRQPRTCTHCTHYSSHICY